MAWYDSAIFYHMYPLGMVGADKENDGGEVRQHFHELTAFIPYLKVLGCDAIYIGPIFESGSHGYDTIDYKMVDRRIGSNEDFRKFVDTAHNYGIHVVVDTVFNHTGRGFFAFRDIQEKLWDSPYKDWYKGIDFSQRSPLGDSFSYSAWRNAWELPELNFNNEYMRKYLIEVVQYWVDTFDIDGLRLDCADVLDINFQKSLRYFTTQMKPEFWIMGEVIHGEYPRWVNAETLHSVTNYELHKSIYSGFNSHNFFEIAHNLNRNMNIARDLYLFLENHDVDRIASKLENKDNLRSCYMALFTLPGKPSIYYGGEFGLEGKKRDGWDDSPLRPSINIDEMKPNKLTSFIAKLAEIHGKNSELHMGQYKELYLQCKQWAYARLDTNSAVITALNNDEEPAVFYVTLPVKGNVAFDLLTEEEIRIEQDNRIMITLKPNSGKIIKVK
ncbi:alpha-amylase [Oribacterium sp. C9]|uniref:alpha-amylase family glycosyl hydrolase n=1 Tax=Oribacterium sp. C9 TaxID=1943579 RepID=UPI00098FFD2D|nr:alpha-amylase family glycosyl hydrolase [Oribacterium sp. C9]OON88298.1 alpha-amylase [Oribacterium sp. C9]